MQAQAARWLEFSDLREGGDFNHRWVNKHFALIDEWGQNSSAKHLSNEEWEFGGSVSGFVIWRYP